eukprot:Skav210708  [mRNA]  locus=scaffold1582:14899:53715:+ [translate_table: standard]
MDFPRISHFGAWFPRVSYRPRDLVTPVRSQVDVATSSIVDSLLDAAIELMEVHEGWHPPASHARRRLHSSTPLLNRSRTQGDAESPLASWANLGGSQSPKSLREQISQPELPPRWRQPVDRSRGVKDMSLSRSLDLRDDKGKTLKHFRSNKPFNPFMARLYAFTDSQRPQRRLQREPRDPFAPKWNFPMMAHHFPEHWERLVPPATPKAVIAAPVSSSKSTTSMAVEEGYEEEEEDLPHSFRCSQTRDGQTVFPYSLASHRAFFQSYQDAELRAKAEAVVPLRMTEWPSLDEGSA